MVVPHKCFMQPKQALCASWHEEAAIGEGDTALHGVVQYYTALHGVIQCYTALHGVI